MSANFFETLLERMKVKQQEAIEANRQEYMSEMENDPEKWDSIVEAGCDGYSDGWNACMKALESCSEDMKFHKFPEEKPDPFVEVIVLVEGHRRSEWSNNYQLIAFMSPAGSWWEERHSEKPLEGVLGWWEKPRNPNLN